MAFGICTRICKVLARSQIKSKRKRKTYRINGFLIFLSRNLTLRHELKFIVLPTSLDVGAFYIIAE